LSKSVRYIRIIQTSETPMRRFPLLPILCLLLALPLFQGCGESEPDPEAFFKQGYRIVREMDQKRSALLDQLVLNYREKSPDRNTLEERRRDSMSHVSQMAGFFLWDDIYLGHESYAMEFLMEFNQNSPPLPALYTAYHDYLTRIALPTVDVIEAYLPGSYRYEGDREILQAMREALADYRAHARSVAGFLERLPTPPAALSGPVHKGLAANKIFQPVRYSGERRDDVMYIDQFCPPYAGVVDLDAPIPPLSMTMVMEHAKAAREAVRALGPLFEMLIERESDPYQKELYSRKHQMAVIDLERFALQMDSTANKLRLFAMYETQAPKQEAFKLFPLFRIVYESPANGFIFSLIQCSGTFDVEKSVYLPLPEKIESILRDMYGKITQSSMLRKEILNIMQRDFKKADSEWQRIRVIVYHENAPALKPILDVVKKVYSL